MKFLEADIEFKEFEHDDEDEEDPHQESSLLIDLDDAVESQIWTPSDPSQKPFYNQAMLDVLGRFSNCTLSADVQNNSVKIQPRTASDIQGVKQRLSNLESIYARPLPLIHVLKLQKNHPYSLMLHRLHEEKEPGSRFNSDGTLTRLLIAQDSPLHARVKGEKAKPGNLTILRYYKQKEPQKRIIQPMKPAINNLASSFFNEVKVNDIGSESPRQPIPGPQVTANEREIEKWRENISAGPPPKSPAAPPKSVDTKAVSKKSFTDTQTGPHITKDTPLQSNQPQSLGMKPSVRPDQAIRNPPSVSMSPGLAWSDALRRQVPSHEHSGSQWITKAPNRNQRQKQALSTETAQLQQPTFAVDFRKKNAAASVSSNRSRQGIASTQPSSRHPVQQTREGIHPGRVSQRNGPQTKAPEQNPRHSKVVTSSNPFDSLIDISQDTDDGYASESEQEGVVDELAEDEEEQPPRYLVSRQKAPAPASVRAPGSKSAFESRDKRQNASPLPSSRSATCNDWLRGHCTRGLGCKFVHEVKTQSKDVLASSSGTDATRTTGSTNITCPETNNDLPHNDDLTDKESKLLDDCLAKVQEGLERARAVHGTISVEAEVGQVVLEDAKSDLRKMTINSSNFLETFNQLPKFDSLKGAFTNHVTTNVSDMDSLLDILSISSAPFHTSAFLDITCERSDKANLRFIVDVEPSRTPVAESLAKSPISLHAVLYAHHPQRVWDHRISVSSVQNSPISAFDGAEEYIDNLCIRNEDKTFPGPSPKGQDVNGLRTTACQLVKLARWKVPEHLTANESIYIQQKKVVNLVVLRKPDVDPSLFIAAYFPEEQLISNQNLWFEVTLGFNNLCKALVENEPYPDIVDPTQPSKDCGEVDLLGDAQLELGDKASWKPEDVLSKEKLSALHMVTTKLVERIDGVGALNRGPGQVYEERMAKKAEQERNQQDVFW